MNSSLFKQCYPVNIWFKTTQRCQQLKTLFLREEEEVRILALKKEQEEKKRKAEERADRMDYLIKSLEDKIQLIEKELTQAEMGLHFYRLATPVTGHLVWLLSQCPEEKSLRHVRRQGSGISACEMASIKV
ncbi:hypothetical protein PAMP_020749 [Pampus punctatissimus]